MKLLSEFPEVTFTPVVDTPVPGEITEPGNLGVGVNRNRFGGGPVFGEIYFRPPVRCRPR